MITGGGVIIPSPASVPSFSVVFVVFVVVFVVFDVVVALTTGGAIVTMRGISGVREREREGVNLCGVSGGGDDDEDDDD